MPSPVHPGKALKNFGMFIRFPSKEKNIPPAKVGFFFENLLDILKFLLNL
jgi:hypothetical protein